MTTLEAPPRTYASRGGAALAPARRTAPRPAPEVQPRHLRVVAPNERTRRRLTPAAGVLLTALLFAVLLAIAIAHTLLVQGQIRLDELDAQLNLEQARYQELRKEVAEMESPARVVEAAQALGMVAPDDLVYLQPEASDPAAASAPVSAEEDAARTPWSVMKPLLESPAP